MRPSGLVVVAGFEPATREAYAAALTAAGLRTAVTSEGVGALMKAAALRPRAIVLDSALAGISGFEVARRLQGDVVIVIVGDDNKDEEDAARFAWLRKECSPAVLVTAVVAQLAR